MDTAILHTQILSWIQGAPTTIDGELRCVAASAVSEELSGYWGVNLGSWDTHIHQDFSPYSVLESLNVRVGVELRLLAETDDMDEWEFLYTELMSSEVDSVPVIAPGQRVNILHRDASPLDWMIEDWAKRFARVPAWHAMAVSMVSLRNAISGGSMELPRIYGPAVARHPSGVCRQANHWLKQGRKAEARAHLREYLGLAGV